MSSHSNSSNAHDFFYLGVDNQESHSYSGCSLSYHKNDAISYSTIIAKVIPAKGVKKENVRTSDTQSGITLVSFNSMTATTAKHISYVAHASPFPRVYVPMQMGRSDLDPRELKRNFLENLEFYYNHLNTRDNRFKFTSLMEALNQIVTRGCDEWAKPLKSKEFDKYRKVDISKQAKEIQARNRKDAIKKAAETKAILKKYVGERHGADYIEFLRAVFDHYYHSDKYPMTSEVQALLRRKMGSGTEHAYVWTDGDRVATSRGVKVPVEEVKLAMQAWAHGHDMRTHKIGYYQVVKYEGSEIQIGCHHIPRENVLELYQMLMGKPFKLLPKMGEKEAAA